MPRTRSAVPRAVSCGLLREGAALRASTHHRDRASRYSSESAGPDIERGRPEGHGILRPKQRESVSDTGARVAKFFSGTRALSRLRRRTRITGISLARGTAMARHNVVESDSHWLSRCPPLSRAG